MAEQGIRDLEESDCPGRFWIFGVGKWPAVVVLSHSLRDRTQREKLAGRSGARCWGIFGWLVGKGEVGTPIAGDGVRTGVAGHAAVPGRE